MIERRGQIYDRHRENRKKFRIWEPYRKALSPKVIDYHILLIPALFSCSDGCPILQENQLRMKTTIFLFVTLYSIVAIPFTGIAQTYTVTSNGETWSTLVGGNSCAGCTIDIPAGWAIALLSTGSCAGCTFNGGSLNITNFSFTGSSTFENNTVNLSSSITFNNAATFSNSTVNFGGNSLTFNTSILTVSNSIFNMPTGSSLTANKGLTSSGSTYNLTGSAAFSVNGGTTFSGDNITMSNTASATFNSGMTLTNGSFTTSNTAAVTVNGAFTSSNSTLSFNNSSSFNPSSNANISGGSVTVNDNAKLDPSSTLTVTGSTVTVNTSGTISASTIDLESTNTSLNGNSTLTASGTITVGTGSDLTIGDGSGNDAGVSASNLNVTGGSFVGIAAGSNTLKLSSGKFKNDHGNVTIANTTTGCETLNNSGVATCVVLALVNINLTAVLEGSTVALSWTDDLNSTANSYLVQRSIGNDDWTTLMTVNANLSGVYHFEDRTATSGTSDYRIVRVGQDGNSSWSAICTVTIAHTSGTVNIFPNPASGHTFYVTVPGTDQLVLNVYTLTGQLIMRTTLQGQTQYPVRLPIQLPAGTAVVVQTILQEQTASFPLLLR